ncbi:unnamed protein product [Schistosoma mattheei]|uniref:Uncharacterized protein n=1 Tax=Schistosoma mattheei TaxID=31246 RepID=A0A183Q157_9TREM|nr:unnamed protein product [Schistosoma mattheei]
MCKDGKCNCLDSCPSEWNSYNRQLCVDGVTYRHECDLWRNQCYCRSGDSRCGNDQFSNHRANENSAIKYYDECRGRFYFKEYFNIKYILSKDG